MMVEDESEVFEITDFTTASDWERFIARLEEQIHEWKLNTVTAGPPLTKTLIADHQACVRGQRVVCGPQGELTTGTWEEKSLTIHYADFSFVLTRHRLKQDEATMLQDVSLADVPHAATSSCAAAAEEDAVAVPIIWQDMMSSENAFPSRAHCLCRWYGLRDFIVLAAAPHMEDITSESRINMLLSSMSIAANNTGCQVPMFLQTHSRGRRLYAGLAEFPGFRTSFEMVELKSSPQQYSHLAGLLDVFKSKIAAPVSVLPPASVAVRFTYTLHDWTQYSWSQQPPDVDNFSGEVGVTCFDELPFGAYDDPIVELSLSTTWPSLSEEMIVDNDVYSDLDPLQAPHWSLRSRFTEKPHCLLGDYLNEFFKLCSRQDSVRQLLGKAAIAEDGEVDMGKALHLLTERGPRNLPSLEKAVSHATSRLVPGHEEAPIAVDRLNKILLFLFPDAVSGSPNAARPVDEDDHFSSFIETDGCDGFSKVSGIHSACSSGHDPAHDVDHHFKDLFKQLKSSPPSSLTSRLATCMCIINHSYGTPRAIAHLWQEFVLEMRYRWEKCYIIPDLETGSPNMGCSLLHQKLQMLNCCIERKKSREATSQGGDSRQTLSASDLRRSSSKSSDEDSEEFYECVEDSDKPAAQSPEKTDGMAVAAASDDDASVLESSNVFNDSASSFQAEGRLKPHGNLRLLNVDEILYVPVTQEPAPMTEDMLEEHAEVLARLGTSAEGTHLRARMQSACLLSDMEAFKAANPGSVLGDFVRWYSPRDWVEQELTDDDGSVRSVGELSQRMQIPGNMWLEVWQSARPVPARRQRRLFDDTKEAEKVIHWLSSMTISDIAVKLMPMLIHSAISRLAQHDECQLPVLRKLMSQITNKAMKATRSVGNDARRFEDLIRTICHAETIITRAQSLFSKFVREIDESHLEVSELRSFISDLLEHPEVNVIGAARAPLGRVIQRLFINSHRADAMMDDDDDFGVRSTSQSGRSSLSSSAGTALEFPAPLGKEYILCMMINRPAPWSRPSPQRMYCVLTKPEFRLAGAFTTDTNFQ